MNATNDTPPAPPRSILLATDLSADCDRALDRAVALARHWKASLHVVHALSSSEPTPAWWALEGDPNSVNANQIDFVKRNIRRDLPESIDDLAIHVELGDPYDVISRTAAREACDLIVVGARGPSFASLIGQTVTGRLLYRSPHSLLIVKTRPRSDYQHVLVRTDLSPESRCGLETAAAWFSAADITLLHALDIPYRSMFMDAGHSEQFARMEADTTASFMNSAHLPAQARERVQRGVAYGYPEIVLSDYSTSHEIDLTVIGALRRAPILHLLARGTTARIMQSVPTDVLIVRDAAPRG